VAPRLLARLAGVRRRLDPAYAFLLEPPPPGECVALDCETTGLDRKKADIVSIAAVRIRGDRILTSERFVRTLRPSALMNPDAIKVHGLRSADVASALSAEEAIPEFLRFVGSRPLVGYYLDFDVAMLDRHVRFFTGVGLPNERIETSALYYELKFAGAPPGSQVDLRFASMLADLGLPLAGQHDAYSDALMTAMAYLALRDLKNRGGRIARRPSGPTAPGVGA
jgi:DNA polymerase III subunit epsilon